jgi:hypothetical protein
MTDIMKQTISKLTQIVWSKFGVELNVFALSNLTEIERLIQIQENQDLYIPLKLGDTYLGTAVALKGNNLESKHKDLLSDTVRLILEPLFYNQAQSVISAPIENIDLTAYDNSNIIPLFNNAQLGNTFSPNSTIEDAFDLPNEIPKFIIFRSSSPTRARKAVVIAHELLKNWSLINWNDIKNTIHDANDFATIEGATVFIDVDNDNLSPAEKKILQQNRHCTIVFYTKENHFDKFDLSFEPSEEKLSILSLDLDKILMNTQSEFETLSMFLF